MFQLKLVILEHDSIIYSIKYGSLKNMKTVDIFSFPNLKTIFYATNEKSRNAVLGAESAFATLAVVLILQRPQAFCLTLKHSSI